MTLKTREDDVSKTGTRLSNQISIAKYPTTLKESRYTRLTIMPVLQNSKAARAITVRAKLIRVKNFLTKIKKKLQKINKLRFA